jgi:uncharacterized protein YbbC (DUF1343 family)
MMKSLCCIALLLLLSGNAMADQVVKFGIDNLIDTNFELLKGSRVGLVTHAAARTLDGRSTAEVMAKSTNLTLVKIFTPEHGFHGSIHAGKPVQNDSIFGVPAISLYGLMRQPRASMLDDVDVIVIDLQDIGVRSYTYISTMVEVMIVCAIVKKPVYVLDRPNPWGGTTVDGAMIDRSLTSFIGRIHIPYVHGMTIGEIATMVNGEKWLDESDYLPNRRSGDHSPKPIKCKLTVVRLKRWTRTMWWEDLHRPWYPTSPNIPTAAAARAYAVTGILGELGIANIGIGTALPFGVVGTPTLVYDSAFVRRCADLGVSLREYHFAPPSGRFSKEVCKGYLVDVERTARPVRASIEILAHVVKNSSQKTIAEIPPGSISMFEKAIGSSEVLPMLRLDPTARQLDDAASRGLAIFLETRERYLLYP